MVSETEAAHWTAEFAKTGEVRVPPRRRVTALKTLLRGFLLANEIGAVVSAALGRQNWLWWPLVCLVAAPLLIPLIGCTSGWRSLAGRSSWWTRSACHLAGNVSPGRASRPSKARTRVADAHSIHVAQ